MWTRLLLGSALLCPFAGHAACTVVHPTQKTITLVVGGSSCAGDEAKNGHLMRSGRTGDPDNAVSPTSTSPQVSTQEKLNNFSDLRHQARHLSGRSTYYYGQK